MTCWGLSRVWQLIEVGLFGISDFYLVAGDLKRRTGSVPQSSVRIPLINGFLYLKERHHFYTLYSGSDGSSATATKIGNHTHIQGSGGYSATATKIGNNVFMQDNKGNSATATKIGSSIWLDD